MSTAACNGHSGCLALGAVRLLVAGAVGLRAVLADRLRQQLPGAAGTTYDGRDCYKNSAAVTVPKQPITSLAQLKLSGTAVSGGNDTLVFTTPTRAYSTTGKDSVTYLATAWKQAEFNIIGDGGGSKATFNKGSSVTVKVAVTHGSTTAPTCASNAGTTGETNNLTLGACTAVSGSTPYIQFKELNWRPAHPRR